MVDFHKWFPALAIVALSCATTNATALLANTHSNSIAIERFSCATVEIPVVKAVPVAEEATVKNIAFYGNTNLGAKFDSAGVNEVNNGLIAHRNLANVKIFVQVTARFIASNPGFGQKVVVAIDPLTTNDGYAGLGASTPACANNVGKFADIDPPETNALRIIPANYDAANGANSRANYQTPAQADHPAQVALRE